MSRPDANGPNTPPARDRLWHQDFTLLAGVWLFMTSAYVAGGAYNTDEFGLFHRLALWLIVTGLVVFQPALIERVFARFTAPDTLGAWLSAFAAVLIAVPLVAVEVHLLKSTPLLPRRPDPWIEFIPFIAAPVIIVAGFVLFLRFAWERRYLADQRPLAANTRETTPAPSAIGAETLYVRSQDHYLEIVTDGGRRFIRGRLTDLAAQGDAWGFSPHRSWWIADRAIETYQRAGRDGRLVLIDGTQVPVSRARQPEVKARGWVQA